MSGTFDDAVIRLWNVFDHDKDMDVRIQAMQSFMHIMMWSKEYRTQENLNKLIAIVDDLDFDKEENGYKIRLAVLDNISSILEKEPKFICDESIAWLSRILENDDNPRIRSQAIAMHVNSILEKNNYDVEHENDEPED